MVSINGFRARNPHSSTAPEEGYVYVMTNQAMVGLVKVGYTTNNPYDRARQLSGTHSPHPMLVQYSTFVSDPRTVEAKAHIALLDCREGKEWFHCTVDEAIKAIKLAIDQAHARREQADDAGHEPPIHTQEIPKATPAPIEEPMTPRPPRRPLIACDSCGGANKAPLPGTFLIKCIHCQARNHFPRR